MMTCKCKLCGTDFSVKPYRYQTAKFCSRRCTNIGTRADREPKRLFAIKNKRPYNYNKATRECLHCKIQFFVSPSRKSIYCSKRCYSNAQTTLNHPNYRYLRITINGDRKYLHRYVAEEMLGRPLIQDEQVHHRNKNRHDNRPENLEVLTAVEHGQLHAQERLEKRHAIT